MVMLVDLDQTKERLRFDHDLEDDTLTLLIEGASGAVMNYLNLAHTFYDDSFGSPADVPAEVQNAVLLLTGILSRDRSGVEMKDWEQGYLPRPVTALLYPLRDPALA